MCEWLKQAVLKTAVPETGTGGSNPSPSAMHAAGSTARIYDLCSFALTLSVNRAFIWEIVDPLRGSIPGHSRALLQEIPIDEPRCALKPAPATDPH